MDLHVGLTIHRSGVGLRFLGGDCGVAGDHLGHHTAESLHAERERSDIQQQNVFHLTGQHTALDGGAHGHHLIGVHRLIGVFAGDTLDQLQHRRDAGGTTHHHDLVELAGGELGVLEGLLHRHAAAVDQFGSQLLKLGAGEGEVEVLGALGRGRDERQVDLALGGAGQLDLGLLSGLGEALQGLLVLAEIDALIGLEAIGQVIHDHLVEVVAAEMGITGGGENLKHTVAHLQHRHVEGAAAEVEDQDALVALAVEAVGQGRGGGLVDDAQHLKAGDLAGILGGLALGIIEVGGHGDHRLGDGFTEVLAGIFGQLAQHLSRDLLGGELLVEHR